MAFQNATNVYSDLELVGPWAYKGLFLRLSYYYEKKYSL